MNWKAFFIEFFRFVVLAILGATLALGVVGFFVDGRNGFVNGATWGFVLGLVSVPFTAFTMLAKYWGDVSGRYGDSLRDEDK